MKICTWLVVGLILGLLFGCSPGESPTPTPLPTATLPPATPTFTPTATPSPTPTEVPLAARANNQPILLADFERELARAGDTATPRQVLDKMIEMVLLEQAAIQAGVTVADEELDAIIQSDINAVGGPEVFETRLASNDLTAQEYREQVRLELLAQRVQLQIPDVLPATAEHVHARHILVASQQEAQAILDQLQDGADFATLAQTYSLDVTTRDRGGDLGFFPRGVLLAPELEEAVFALAPGQVSQVVHSQLLGYHVVQVLEREERPISELNLEAIKANQREGIRRWKESLWAEAIIERYVTEP